MCGIAGVWPARLPFDSGGVAREMIAALRHRGPDAQAYWVDERSGLALAHARLSILDLSPAGAQPMRSASGRYQVVFNGEIYNHLDLRVRLERSGSAPAWRGHSDTETLLALFESLGIQGAIDQCTGMFALAVWDTLEHKLLLVRDRFGEKPLYWSAGQRGLAFGSELKAVVRSRLVDIALSRNAAAALLRYNNIPAPHTVYTDVHKVMPGHIIEFRTPTAVHSERQYWSPFDAWVEGKKSPFRGTAADAVDEVESRLSRIISSQMLSDVPLGAFLSGGIDSSLIVALMQKSSASPVRTFSMGFVEKAYNEAHCAKSVAQHIGTEHRELYVSPQDALDVIPLLPGIYCEPFADSSQIPTYMVAKFAREHVTVALTGDGGDEVFGGYNRYLFGSSIHPHLMRVPVPARRFISALLRGLRPAQWDRVAASTRQWLPGSWRFPDAGDKLQKLSRALAARDSAELYETFLQPWSADTAAVVPGATSSLTSSNWQEPALSAMTFTEQMMVQDAIAYLPNDILVKVDRAGMAASIEGRIPFLDHHLYGFAASLPADFKIRAGNTKWVLKQILHRHVPRELVERPKVGFAVPIERWLREELRDWAESLLSNQALSKVGMFDAKVVRDAWSQHLAGKHNLQHPLWCVLMYQAWHSRWFGNA